MAVASQSACREKTESDESVRFWRGFDPGSELPEPAKIACLFGQVSLLPNAAEMVGGAAERQRQPPGGKARQEHVEQSGIFCGEHARQPAIRRVVYRKPRLHAGESRVAGDERFQRKAELVGFRPVLRIEHRHECAARERQRGVEGLRFGARAAPWRDDDFERWSELQRVECLPRLLVVGFDYELDIELLRWVIERLQGGDEPGRRRRLPVQRHDD